MGKRKPKKSKKKLIIFGGLALLLVIVVVVVIAGGSKEQLISVQTENVEKRDITQIVSATGKINPVEQVVLRPEVTGEIVDLPVEEGDKVRKGQLLIRIKPEQYIAARDRAKANLESTKANLKVRKATLEQVESEYNRVKGLYAKGLASDSDLESALALFLQSQGQYEAQKAFVSQSESSLKESEEQLAKTTIYSPIDGTISVLNVEMSERVLGSSFSQGTHLMTVADLNEMEARVDVDENDVVLISVGDTSRIEIDAFGDEQFTGLVTQIGNSAITTGLGSQDEVVNFEVRVRLVEKNEKIRPGMSCDADIETETRLSVLTVPIQSVTARIPKFNKNGPNNGGGNANSTSSEESGEESKNDKKKRKPKEVVFAIDGNKAKMVEVETGISDDDYIEIISGLEGEESIVSGPYRAISKELEDDVTVIVQGGKKDKEKKNEENEN
jgi:HlyD family secretion protein